LKFRDMDDREWPTVENYEKLNEHPARPIFERAAASQFWLQRKADIPDGIHVKQSTLEQAITQTFLVVSKTEQMRFTRAIIANPNAPDTEQNDVVEPVHDQEPIVQTCILTLTIPAGEKVSTVAEVTGQGVTGFSASQGVANLQARAGAYDGDKDSGTFTQTTVSLLPVEIYSDLNNDGTLTSADSGLTGKPYASGASDEEKDKGTEFIFLNDDLSNGAWDRNDSKTPSDGKPADPNDDDAEEIVIKLQASQGEIWLEHPAINSLKFYDNAKCTGTEVPLKSGNRLNLATRTIPEHVYMRVETEVSGYQSAGDLVLKYATTAGGAGTDATKMKLVVVDDIRAEKHHRVVVDYIREKNTKHYFNWVDRTKADSAYVGYLAKNTNIDGIDPRGGVGWLGGGIHSIQEAMSLGADAVVVGNYAGGHTYPIIGDNYWPTFQDGEIYEGGSWNHLTSHTAANARVGYWRTIISGGGFSHETMFGDIPAAGTSGGMAGLVHEPIRSDGGTSAMGRADVSEEDTVIYLNSGYSSRQLGIFEAALKIGIIPPQHPNSDGWAFRQFDGGNSTALAVASPSGTMFLPTEYGGRHKPGTAGYAIFEAAGDLVGAYIRLDPRKPRVPVP
jgi:hypothetical protein